MIVDCRSEDIPVVYANGMRVGLKPTGFEIEGLHGGQSQEMGRKERGVGVGKSKRSDGFGGEEGEVTVGTVLMTLAKAMLGGKAGPATQEEEELVEGLKRQMREDVAAALEMRKSGEVEKRGEDEKVDMHDVVVMIAKSMLHGKAEGELTDAEGLVVDALERGMLGEIEAETGEEKKLPGAVFWSLPMFNINPSAFGNGLRTLFGGR